MRKEEIVYTGFEEHPTLTVEVAGITYPDPYYKIYRTNSTCIVLEYVIRGKGHIQCGTKTWSVKAGDFYLLLNGGAYCYGSDKDEPYEKIWVNIHGLLAENLCRAFGFTKPVTVCKAPLLNDFCSWHRLLREEKRTQALRRESGIWMHRILEKASEAAEMFAREEKPELAHRIREAIDQRLQEKFRLGDIAAELYISRVHLIRVFREAYGQTPYDYAIQNRLRMAERLLVDTNASVKEIAVALCFADEHYFCNRFRQATGLTPAAYRRHAYQKALANR